MTPQQLNDIGNNFCCFITHILLKFITTIAVHLAHSSFTLTQQITMAFSNE